jgi:predicted nicotinamide N-methyase
MRSHLKHLLSDYETDIFPVKIGERELQFHKPKNIDRFINHEDALDNFPLWAKIWEASIVLMQHMVDLPVIANRRILELGSGLGMAGIAAAAIGHDITLTEYNEDALNFLRANAEVNNCGHLGIQHLDWFKPVIEETYDLIIGSEIVYQDSAVEALGEIFSKLLSPGGQVILTERVRSTGAVFFDKMTPHFDIGIQQHTLRSKQKSETVIIFELTKKK